MELKAEVDAKMADLIYVYAARIEDMKVYVNASLEDGHEIAQTRQFRVVCHMHAI